MKQKWFHKDEKTKRFDESGHVWKTEGTYIDIFANGSDDHNGPLCIVCNYGECWHCEPNPPKCKGVKS